MNLFSDNTIYNKLFNKQRMGERSSILETKQFIRNLKKNDRIKLRNDSDMPSKTSFDVFDKSLYIIGDSIVLVYNVVSDYVISESFKHNVNIKKIDELTISSIVHKHDQKIKLTACVKDFPNQDFELGCFDVSLSRLENMLNMLIEFNRYNVPFHCVSFVETKVDDYVVESSK